MPNVTIFLSEDTMPSDAALASLTERCTQLCTDVFHAALETVHIIYVPVRHGRGHPVFADICYRLGSSRTPPVMERFMGELDTTIQAATGATARIRCFGFAADHIHARN